MPDWNQILDEALKTKQPDLYASLQKQGQLESHLAGLVLDAEELYNGEMKRQSDHAPLPSGFQARVNRLNQDASAATEIVIAQLTEAPTDEPPTV